MPFIQVGQENSGKIELYYEDHGAGEPVVLIHGWPLSGRSWEKQTTALLNEGYRVITYDRRGFGESSKPTAGYDYDTLAKDLDTVLTKLDLHEVNLVGFSMGGGEVARYLGTYGSKRISKAAFLGAITPALLKSADNPEGVDGEIFKGIQKSLATDRPAFLQGFLQNFFNVDKLKGKSISDEAVHMNWIIASMASPKGSSDCVTAWGTDFRKDLAKIDVPTLIVHGDSDRIVPMEASGARMTALVKGSKMTVIKGAPHGFGATHADETNAALLEFFAQGKR